MGKEGIDEALLLRFFKGSATSQEIEKVIHYINEDRENRLKYFNTKRIWLESAIGSKDSDFINDSWDRLKFRLEENENLAKSVDLKKTRHPVRILALAASFAFLIAVSSYLYFQNYRSGRFAATESEVVVPYGSRTNITLPDGSQVWLNSGSRLTYSSDFSRNRKVSLIGEAFFDVQKLDKKQFIVNAGDLRIRVLGTSFNVKSYPEEDVIETTLVKGKIEVESLKSRGEGRTVLLAPNQKLVYRKNTDRTNLAQAGNVSPPDEKTDVQSRGNKNMRIVRNIDTEEDSSWKDGKLIIKSELLEDLAIKLERYYNVEIVFQDDSIKNLKYSGTLEEVTIAEVLNAIASASPIPIQYEIAKNKVTLALK
jgi:transmembrane sensor